ncbi:hypothetical protein EVAR_37258_1 [Eumeta japonica]|uniref:Uncharacterized protein n=1 Tax=Eumeta variegata TaxID=151549 RepID=A0A4C1WLP6_EUMVA|nr:hypothetical protein EVAR_37258_1 [Eumeta japonica]
MGQLDGGSVERHFAFFTHERLFVNLLRPVRDAGTGMSLWLGPALLLVGTPSLRVIGPMTDIICLLVDGRRLACALENHHTPSDALRD